ncbi:MAG: T9SS type A sorting domain-containing protein [Bacteroidales bacterium]|nr:T9SS type A sorting domain-containing protein [Bacteroidales bacterium]
MTSHMYPQKVILLSVLLLVLFHAWLFAQPYIPVQTEGLGPGYNLILSAGSDTAGHFFFAGNYSGMLKLQERTLKSSGRQTVFWGRLGRSGQLDYLHALGGTGFREVQSGLFLPDGTGYLAIQYRDTLPGPGKVHYAYGRGTLALVRLDAGGDPVEINDMITGFSGRIYDMVADTGGVLYLGGRIRRGRIDEKIYRSVGKSDALLITLKPDTVPEVAFTGGEGGEEIRLLRIHQGQLFLAGVFNRTLVAGKTTLRAGSRKAVWLARQDKEERFTDIRLLAGSADISLTSAVLPAEGNSLYLSGWYRGEMTLQDTVVAARGNEDGFVMKVNADSSCQVLTLGDHADDRVISLATDKRNRLFMTATFRKKLFLDIDTLVAEDRFSDLIFARFDTSFSLLWVRQISGVSEENNTFLTVMPDRSVWLGGHAFRGLNVRNDEQDPRVVPVENGSYLLKYIDPCTLLHFDMPDEKIICRGIPDTLDAGSGFIKYLWTPGDYTKEKIPIQDTGYYSAHITDHYGCTAHDSIHVSADSVRLAFKVQDETLPGGSNGAVDMTLVCGIPPYGISWDNGEETEDLCHLQAGLYHVRVVDSAGCETEAEVEVPLRDLTAVYDLYNYPNPFEDLTQIVYSLPEGTYVEISLFDLAGRKILLLTGQTSRKGIHSFEWSRKNLKDGVYYLRMQSRYGQVSRKIVILKKQ